MNPLLLDLPDSLTTERLLLRSPQPGDGPATNAAIVESFENLHAWTTFADHIPSLEESEERCRRAHARFLMRDDLPFALFLKTDGAFVGRCELHPMDWAVPSFEIGYWCRTCFQGQGYITEAVRAVTRFGFETLGANRIAIRCDPRNVRSRRVAERAGYRVEAELRDEQIAPDGKLRNTLVFALLRREAAFDREE